MRAIYKLVKIRQGLFSYRACLIVSNPSFDHGEYGKYKIIVNGKLVGLASTLKDAKKSINAIYKCVEIKRLVRFLAYNYEYLNNLTGNHDEN